MTGPLEDAAIRAHAERWEPVLRRDGGMIAAVVKLDVERGGFTLHWGSILADMPTNARKGAMLATAGYMKIVADAILAEIDDGEGT